MNNNKYTSLRRQFLSLGLTGAVIGTAGCTGVLDVEEQSESDTDGTGSNPPSPDLASANISFEYDSEAQEVEIQFDGGANIRAGDVQIQHESGKEVTWAELGSTTAGPDEQIQPGATAVLGANILNWGIAVAKDETIRLVYIGKETPATLERFSPPETTKSTTIIPASISSFNIESQPDKRLQLSFNSNRQLRAIQVSITGSETTTLTASDFTEAQISDGRYSYEATYDASSDGEFTATLDGAVDVNGNDSTNGQSISDTTAISSGETTPRSISAFRIKSPSNKQLRTSFDSSKQLSQIQVNISGPESITLTKEEFSATDTSNGTYSYEATFDTNSSGKFTATLEEAVDVNGNDNTNGQLISDTAAISSEETTQPSISAFSIANPSDQQLRTSFDSNKQLSQIQVSISGPRSITLTTEEFSAIETGNGIYTYEATFDANSSGEFTATLEEAVDKNGGDGSSSESVTLVLSDDSATLVMSHTYENKLRDQANDVNGMAAESGLKFPDTSDGRIAAFTGENNGNDDSGYYDIPDAKLTPYFSEGDSMSLSLWIKPNSLSGWQMLFNGNGITLDLRYGRVRFRWYDNGSNIWNITASTEEVLSTDGWTHLVATLNTGQQAMLYADGSRIGQESVPEEVGFQTDVKGSHARLGYHPVGSDAGASYTHYDGYLDSVQLYRGVLTEDSVQELTNNR